MKKLISSFNKNYPYNQSGRHQIVLGLLFGLWIFLFLWISDGFELYQLSSFEKLKRCIPYAGMGIVSYWISLVYQRRFIKKRKQWFLTNEIGLLLIACALALVLIYGVFILFGNENPEKLLFLNYLTTVYLPSLIIILPFLTVGRFLIGKSKISKKPPNDNLIKIKGNTDDEFIELNFERLLYLNASGNYVEVHYIFNSVLERKILRRTLADIEMQFPQLYRTHRSYLINALFFKGFIKEKTNLFVDLGFETKIPIARNRKAKAQNDLPFKTKI